METKKNNPFNISFGEIPANFIPRETELKTITDSFESLNPESKIFVLTGPRGSGKTVFLSQAKNYFEEKSNWITVNLKPYGDMIEQLCASIYEKGKVKHLFLKVEFNFSFKGIGFSISGAEPISNAETLLEKMFKYLKGKKYKVLIVVDDISSNEYTKYFAHSYQNFIREGYDTFLLASGLYENISALENDKSLTFLIRAPKIYLERLSLSAIANSYIKLLQVDQKTAIKLSKFTMGFAYGYQLLGNLLYKNNKNFDDNLLSLFDLTLEDNVYSLIWHSLSKKDKEILIAIAEDKTEVNSIREATNITNSALQVYKNRLSKAGLIDSKTRGKITLALPRFKEYILMQKEFE